MTDTDRRQSPRLVRRSVIAAAAIAIFSIGLANALSRMVQNGVLSSILFEFHLRRLAQTAPVAQGHSTTTVRSIDIDGIRTSTIPHP
jgi:hypothetical protein